MLLQQSEQNAVKKPELRLLLPVRQLWLTYP